MMSLTYLAITLGIIAVLAYLTTRIPLPSLARTVVNIALALIAIGIVLWLINNYIPMAASIKAILNIVVVVATCVGILQALGLWNPAVQYFNSLVSRARTEEPREPRKTDMPSTPRA